MFQGRRKCGKKRIYRLEGISCDTQLTTLYNKVKIVPASSARRYFLDIQREPLNNTSVFDANVINKCLHKIKRRFIAADIKNVTLCSQSAKNIGSLAISQMRLRNVTISEIDLDLLFEIRCLNKLEFGKINSKEGWRAIRKCLKEGKKNVVFSNLSNIRTIKPTSSFIIERFAFTNIDQEDFVSGLFLNKLLKCLNLLSTMKKLDIYTSIGRGSMIESFMDPNSNNHPIQIWETHSYHHRINSQVGDQHILPFKGVLNYEVLIQITTPVLEQHSMVSYLTQKNLSVDVAFDSSLATSDYGEYLKKIDLMNDFYF